MDQRSKSGALAYTGLVLTTLFWAGNVIVARGVIELIPPVALSFWRWFIAFLLILPFIWRGLWRQRRIIAENWPWLLLLAALSVGFFNTLLYLAAHSTVATNIGLINASMPVMVLLLSRLVLGTPLSLARVAGIGFGIAGILIIISEGSLASFTRLTPHLGDLYMLLAVLLWSLFSVLLKSRPVHLGGREFLGVQIGLGTLVILPLYLIEFFWTGGFEVSGTIFAPIAYVAIFPGILAYGLWNFGVARLGPQSAAMSSYLVPLFVALLAWVFLGEQPTHYHLTGGAMVLIGVYLATHQSVPRIESELR